MMADRLKKSEHSRFAGEILDFFIPLAMQLPRLRNNPSLMAATVKATGASGVQDVLTEADKFVQQKLKDEVGRLHPDWQFWGEEGEDNTSAYDSSKRFLFITDPIEGTNNFRAGRDEDWGSVVALVDIGTRQPVIGIVAHPVKRRCDVGIKDRGAYIFQYDESSNLTSVVEMSKTPEAGYEQFTYNNSPHFNDDLVETVQRFFALGEVQPPVVSATDLEKSRKTVVMEDNKGIKLIFIDPESGALEVIRNRGTIYFSTSNEMAAAFVILDELGGVVSTAEAEPWFLGMNTLIAARNREDYDYLKSLYDKAKGA